MSIPYSPTTPTLLAPVMNKPSPTEQIRLPSLSKQLPEIFPYGRPNSPPITPDDSVPPWMPSPKRQRTDDHRLSEPSIYRRPSSLANPSSSYQQQPCWNQQQQRYNRLDVPPHDLAPRTGSDPYPISNPASAMDPRGPPPRQLPAIGPTTLRSPWEPAQHLPTSVAHSGSSPVKRSSNEVSPRSQLPVSAQPRLPPIRAPPELDRPYASASRPVFPERQPPAHPDDSWAAPSRSAPDGHSHSLAGPWDRQPRSDLAYEPTTICIRCEQGQPHRYGQECLHATATRIAGPAHVGSAHAPYPPPHEDRRHSYAYEQLTPNGSSQYTWEVPGVPGDHQSRRRRGNLPKESTAILNQWFCQHIAYPYPKEEEKQTLQHETGLTMAQISNWFINARRRRRPAPGVKDDQKQQMSTMAHV